MLEQFCRHIDSGGRALLRNKRTSKGMIELLLSNFNLAQSTPSQRGRRGVQSLLSQNIEHNDPTSPLLFLENVAQLEFLYPLSAIHFFRHALRSSPFRKPLISPHRVRRYQCERQYSSSSSPSDIAGTDVTISTTKEQDPLISSDEFIKPSDLSRPNLEAFLKAPPASQYEELWYHYCARKDRVKVEQISQCMSYLMTSDRRVDHDRILQLSEQLQTSDLGSTECDAIMMVFLRRNLDERARAFIDNVVAVNPLAAVRAVGRLIGHYIDHVQWLPAIQLFRRFKDISSDILAFINTTVIISYITGFRTKFINWWEENSVDVKDDNFAVWIGRGGVRSALLRKSSEGALEAYDLVNLLHARGFGLQLSLKDYLETIYQLHEFKLYEPAAALYLIYRNTPLMESPSSNDVMKLLEGSLRAFAHLQDFANMEKVFDDWFHFGSRPNEKACLFIMRQFASRGEVQVVREFYDYYLSRFPVRVEVEETLMHAHSMRGEVEEVRRIFHNLSTLGLSPNIFTYNILLNAYKRVDDIDAAFSLFYSMLELNDPKLQPDLITYHSIISLCARRGDVEAVERLIQLMEEHGVSPNQSIYNAWTYSWVQQGTISAIQQASAITTEVLSREEKKPLQGQHQYVDHTRMWNNLLIGYLWAGDLDQMATTYQEMRQHEIPFDTYTYSILMYSLCMGGKIIEAERMLEILEKDPTIKLNATHYAILMLHHMLHKDVAKTWSAYERMIQFKIPPTFITQSILIHVVTTAEYSEYKRTGGILFLEQAEALLGQSISDTTVLDLSSPDPVKSTIPSFLFTPLLQVYAKEGSHQRAVELFNQFQEIQFSHPSGGTKSSLATNTHFMNSLLRSGDTKLLLHIWDVSKSLAMKQFKKVRLKGTSSDDMSILPTYSGALCDMFSIVVKALSLDHEPGRIVWEKDLLQYHGFRLDNVNVNDIVQALMLNRRPQLAMEMCEQLLMPGYAERFSRRRHTARTKPDFYPFVRTLECFLTEIKEYQNAEGTYKGLRKNRRQKILHYLETNFPNTWQALNEMDSPEHRTLKEQMYLQVRMDWGRSEMEPFQWTEEVTDSFASRIMDSL